MAREIAKRVRQSGTRRSGKVKVGRGWYEKEARSEYGKAVWGGCEKRARRSAEEWGDRKGGKEAGVRRKWYAKVRGGGEKERGGEER